MYASKMGGGDWAGILTSVSSVRKTVKSFGCHILPGCRTYYGVLLTRTYCTVLARMYGSTQLYMAQDILYRKLDRTLCIADSVDHLSFLV